MAETNPKSQTKKDEKQAVTVIRRSTSRSPPRMPSSQIVMRAIAFVSRLEISDPRYDVCCYGTFLMDIPRRLGTNASLDAAVDTFTSASASLHTGGRHSVATLTKYGHALKTLRESLDNPVTARKPETLCAIYLIMITQGWMGRQTSQSTSHGEGIAKILRATMDQKWESAFEVEMLVTLCVPVIVESFANPNIQLKPWLEELLDKYKPKPTDKEQPPDPGIINLRLRNLAKVPEFARNPELHLLEIRNAYQRLETDTAIIYQVMISARARFIPSLPVVEQRMSRAYETAYGLLLTLTMVMGGLLLGFDPYNMALTDNLNDCTRKILILAEETAPYRPLGASYIPMCLAAACSACPDTDLIRQSKEKLLDYQGDFWEVDWVKLAIWWRTRFDALHLKTATALIEHASKSNTEVFEALQQAESCLLLNAKDEVSQDCRIPKKVSHHPYISSVEVPHRMGTPDNLFVYDANKILPIVAAVLIGISLLAHTYQNYAYKFWRVTFFMFYGGLFYAIGWIVRCISTHYPDNLPLFIIQSIFIYLGPPLYSAAEYNTLGRLMHYLPMHAVVNPNRVVYIFVFLGSIVEVLTAIGSSWIAGAQGKDNNELLMKGLTCISISVVLQAIVECAFMAMTAVLHYRCRRAKMLPRNVLTVFIMLYGTSLLILVRCVFRSVESFQLRNLSTGGGNKDAALLRHEWPLYAFETLPVLLYTYWLNIIHPGRFLPCDAKQYLDFDGKTERMGPGWIRRREWYLFIADPFDFIGMLSPVKRDKYYLKPESWPEVDRNFAQGTGTNKGPSREADGPRSSGA
ncbi:hypothetical protein G7046_g5878 [Stylonectria norvegica]|nr:hypothetical protein G7046_g5878 [Stylonectria norvegica]